MAARAAHSPRLAAELPQSALGGSRYREGTVHVETTAAAANLTWQQVQESTAHVAAVVAAVNFGAAAVTAIFFADPNLSASIGGLNFCSSEILLLL